MNTEQWIQLATLIGVPLVLGITRIILPKIPSKWIPVAAPFLGAGIDLLSSGTLGQGTAWGAVVGMAGVGLREIFDQWSKPNGGSQVGKITGCLFLLACVGLLGGCAMLSNTASTQSPDGTTKNAKSRGYAVFQSGQTFKSAQAQAGEVLRVGVAEAEQKSDAAAFATAFTAGIAAVAEIARTAYMGGGYAPGQTQTRWVTNTINQVAWVTNVVVITNTP